MRSILPRFILASAVAAMAALTTSNALADSRVNVPFSFSVNGKVCPAGSYSVGRDDTTGVVILRNTEDWKRSFAWVASPGEPAPTDNRIVLRFDKSGENYTLQSVQYHALITARLDGRKNNEAPTRTVIGQ